MSDASDCYDPWGAGLFTVWNSTGGKTIICQHHGCVESAVVCQPPTDYDTNPDAEEPDPEWWCVDHAVDRGFCSACGTFCSGCGSFDIRGLCDTCWDEERTFDDDDEDGDDPEDYSPMHDDGWEPDDSFEG